jgi:hypothetical protein
MQHADLLNGEGLIPLTSSSPFGTEWLFGASHEPTMRDEPLAA